MGPHSFDISCRGAQRYLELAAEYIEDTSEQQQPTRQSTLINEKRLRPSRSQRTPVKCD